MPVNSELRHLPCKAVRHPMPCCVAEAKAAEGLLGMGLRHATTRLAGAHIDAHLGTRWQHGRNGANGNQCLEPRTESTSCPPKITEKRLKPHSEMPGLGVPWPGLTPSADDGPRLLCRASGSGVESLPLATSSAEGRFKEHISMNKAGLWQEEHYLNCLT